MTDFVINTAPFSLCVFNRSSRLLAAVKQLYPAEFVEQFNTNTIYDFCLNVERKWAGKSMPFHVSSGQKHFRMSDTAQLLPIFEWGFNWCVASFQHQYLALHAAVLERDGKALIMPAPPGSGKSTLCAVLMLEGWRLLSDEMCLIDLDSSQIIPFLRPVSLKNESLSLIEKWYPSAVIRQITLGTTKGTVGYLLPNQQSWHAYKQAATPAWVIFPKYDREIADSKLLPLTKADTFMHLAYNSFNYPVLGQVGFTCLANFTKQVSAYRFEYSDINQAIYELQNL